MKGWKEETTLAHRVTLRVGIVACLLLWFVGCAPEPPPVLTADDIGVFQASMSVGTAVTSGCSTAQVDGLTKQLFQEVNCLRPNSLENFGNLAGVKKNASHVYTWMQPAAVASLKKVLARRPGVSMNITSAYRSIAQQYLLYRWYRLGRCGISLAAQPGSSNHQSALALDVSPYSSWKSHFQAVGWRWLGSSDPVHFDFTGSGTTNMSKLAIQAFQRLWNRNNPNDTIKEDGIYGTATESRLAKSPASGFAKGCGCNDGETRACGSSDKGVCKKGTETCSGGKWGACVGEVKPSAEVCDGKDNDCDGDIDEGIAPGAVCQTTQPGICKDGKLVCSGGKEVCKADLQPETEKCDDGKDNDCDGEVDEGCGDCLDGEIQPCGSTVGECREGRQLCTNGKWGACDQQVAPTNEVCDGKDNDCDGQTDEELTSMGQPCNTGLSGQCQSGTSACQSGKLVCVPPAGCGQKESPMTESGSTEPPATTDAGPQGEMTTPDSPGLTDANPTTNDGPQTTWSDKGLGGKNIQCQLSSECPGGQICINNQCYGGVSAQGCGCSTSSEHGQHSFWLMLLFLPFLLRRRSCPNA